MKILAIESSCDETSAAVLEDGKVLSNVISSQYFHGKFGGVVPELASRAHLQIISDICTTALSQAGRVMESMDALAVTSEPGLIGSLIVGSSFAKGLSLRYNLPVIPVNHIEGHIFSGFLKEGEEQFPIMNLVISGGHTALFYVESYNKYSIVGLTRDDAAGEAFDKIAKMIGLTYPGGPLIDKFAKQGNPKAYDFPRSMIHSDDFDFSFSGLKTSVRYFLRKEFPNGVPEEIIPDICASVQSAIADVLVVKSIRAAKYYKAKAIVISGGVSANSQIRTQMAEAARKIGINSVAPEMGFCMDNAAMIGFIAEKKLAEAGEEAFRDLTYTVNSNALRSKKK